MKTIIKIVLGMSIIFVLESCVHRPVTRYMFFNTTSGQSPELFNEILKSPRALARSTWFVSLPPQEMYKDYYAGEVFIDINVFDMYKFSQDKKHRNKDYNLYLNYLIVGRSNTIEEIVIKKLSMNNVSNPEKNLIIIDTDYTLKIDYKYPISHTLLPDTEDLFEYQYRGYKKGQLVEYSEAPTDEINLMHIPEEGDLVELVLEVAYEEAGEQKHKTIRYEYGILTYNRERIRNKWKKDIVENAREFEFVQEHKKSKRKIKIYVYYK